MIKLTDQQITDMGKECTVLKEEFSLAVIEKSKWDKKFDLADDTFLGKRSFNNTTSDKQDAEARTVIKLALMMIEQQIDQTVPDPILKAVEEVDAEVVRELQEVVQYSIRTTDLERINSDAERDCKKYGSVIYKIVWDASGRQARPKIVYVHPKNIFPAAGSTDEDNMDCIFHAENPTYVSCYRTYGDIARYLPLYGQLSEDALDLAGGSMESSLYNTNDIDNSSDAPNYDIKHPYAKYEVIEKWYIDMDGDIGLVVFSGNLILENLPKFFYGRKVDKKTGDYERDVSGEPVIMDADEVEKEVNKKKTKVNAERFIPKELPFIFQRNIPRSKSLWGISDIDILYDLNESMKKIWYKAEDRVLNGSTKIAYNTDLEPDFAAMYNNKDLATLPVKDINNVRTLDLKADDNYVYKLIEMTLDMLQRTIGVNNVWQGVNQGESTSGKMTEMLINQTAEQISKKIYEKNIAYKKIYKQVCGFILAFGNGDISYRKETGTETQYGKFNKYKLLKRTKEGKWIYPDWDVDISAGAAFPKTIGFKFNSLLQIAGGGYFLPTAENVLLWKELAKQGYPDAGAILQDIEQRFKEAQQAQQAQQAQMQAQMQTQQAQPTQQTQSVGEPQLSEEEKKQTLTPDMNEEAIAEAIKGLPPEVQAALSSLSPEEQMKAITGG